MALVCSFKQTFILEPEIAINSFDSTENSEKSVKVITGV